MERSMRPFICTWYLCPPQKLLAEKDTGMEMTYADLIAELTMIKRERKMIERCYLEATGAIEKPVAATNDNR